MTDGYDQGNGVNGGVKPVSDIPTYQRLFAALSKRLSYTAGRLSRIRIGRNAQAVSLDNASVDGIVREGEGSGDHALDSLVIVLRGGGSSGGIASGGKTRTAQPPPQDDPHSYGTKAETRRGLYGGDVLSDSSDVVTVPPGEEDDANTGN